MAVRVVKARSAMRARGRTSMRASCQMPTVGRSGPQSQPQPNWALRIRLRFERLMRSVKAAQGAGGARPSSATAVG